MKFLRFFWWFALTVTTSILADAVWRAIGTGSTHARIHKVYTNTFRRCEALEYTGDEVAWSALACMLVVLGGVAWTCMS